jgi:hypothetical protein
VAGESGGRDDNALRVQLIEMVEPFVGGCTFIAGEIRRKLLRITSRAQNIAEKRYTSMRPLFFRRRGIRGAP